MPDAPSSHGPATWLAIASFALLAAIATVVAQRVPASAAGRLYVETKGVAAALAGDPTARPSSLRVPGDADARSAVRKVAWLREVSAALVWRVVEVDPSRSRTIVAFQGDAERSFGPIYGRRSGQAVGVEFVWRPAPSGRWALEGVREVPVQVDP